MAISVKSSRTPIHRSSSSSPHQPGFKVAPWEWQWKTATVSDWKAPIYTLARPLINFEARRHLGSVHCLTRRPDFIIRERGFPLIARHRWGVGARSLAGKTILVQGTGNGWDVLTWAAFQPARLIAVDAFGFDSWPAVRASAKEHFDVSVEFVVAPLDGITCINDGLIDYCVSDAVFEHVCNLLTALRETYRILKPRGIVYASYGPLWYSAGGDHFSGRGGLQNIFNHVRLDASDYSRYFEAHREKIEDFQSGGRYVELDLFSKLRTQDTRRLCTIRSSRRRLRAPD